MDKKLTLSFIDVVPFQVTTNDKYQMVIMLSCNRQVIFIEICSIKCLQGRDIFKIDFQRTILSVIVDEMTLVDVFMHRRIIEYQLFITAHLSISLAEYHSSISCLS